MSWFVFFCAHLWFDNGSHDVTSSHANCHIDSMTLLFNLKPNFCCLGSNFWETRRSWSCKCKSGRGILFIGDQINHQHVGELQRADTEGDRNSRGFHFHIFADLKKKNLFFPCWSWKLSLVTPKQFYHCFDNSNTASLSNNTKRKE